MAPRVCLTIAFAALLAACAAPVQTGPDPAPEDPPRGTGTLAVMVGAGYWPALGDLEADGSLLPRENLGDFKDWGFAFDLTVQGPVAEVGNADLDLGLDLGFMGFENKEKFNRVVFPPGSVIEDRFHATLFYVAPSARLVFPATPASRVYTGLGLGYYEVSLQDSSSIYYYSNSIGEAGAMGGFVAVGFDVFLGDGSLGIRVEDKLHYADFGGIRGFSNDLDGFINTIEIGLLVVF